MRLDVGGDRGVEIGDAQLVVLLRRFHALLGLGEVRLRVFDRDLVVARIEIDQRLAGFYVIGVLDVDADDGVVYARADRIEMAIDLGIVSPFVRLQIIPEAHPAHTEECGNNQCQD